MFAASREGQCQDNLAWVAERKALAIAPAGGWELRLNTPATFIEALLPDIDARWEYFADTLTGLMKFVPVNSEAWTYFVDPSSNMQLAAQRAGFRLRMRLTYVQVFHFVSIWVVQRFDGAQTHSSWSCVDPSGVGSVYVTFRLKDSAVGDLRSEGSPLLNFTVQ